MKKFIMIVLAFSLLAMPLTACGKKGDPQPPGQSDYPNQYPAPE